MTQIALPLDWPEDERDAEFILSPANAAAVRHLAHPALWPVPATLLTGPARSGRSLLGRLWAGKTGATLIDDAPAQPEEALFHAWNAAAEQRRPLLLIADEAPPAWAVALPDLRSRLSATPRVAILPPDDALLRALVERGLSRRGLGAPPRLLDWLAARMERSYVAAQGAVETLDRAALQQRRPLTVALAREVLGPALSREGVIDA